MVLPVSLGPDRISEVLVVEWIAEAGDRLWLIRSGREMPTGAQLGDAADALAALDDLSVQAGNFPPTSMSQQLARMAPVTNLPTPSWWAGTCDDTNFHAANPNYHSYVLASYLGMPACGPEPQYVPAQHTVYFFQGAWPVTEFQCVELAKRYLYLAYQVAPYQATPLEMPAVMFSPRRTRFPSSTRSWIA